MEKKHKELWEKYWQGETTLEEEKALLSGLEDQVEDDNLRTFFSGVQSIRSEKPTVRLMPASGFPFRKLAAALLFFLTVSACWWGYREYQYQQQAMAYQQVVEAMGKIQLNLRKGTSQLESMEKIKYLNSGANWYENNKNN
jgi:hypothetical protein